MKRYAPDELYGSKPGGRFGRGRAPWDGLGRFAGSYDLIGRPIETMTNVPLGGVVRAGLENMGVDPMYARYGEQGVAGLLSAGIGISALAAAAQALNAPQTPGTLPLSY